MKYSFFLLFIFFPFLINAQVVEESVALDTITENYKVIYRPIEKTTYYYKKIAVFANDTSQVAIEKTFTNDHQNGVYKVYYPSGRLKVFTVYANDSINGEWTWYDPQGVILVKGIYKKGIKHGFWAYKSLKTYGRYKKGKKNGKWYKVVLNDKKEKAYYKNGQLVKGKGFGDEHMMVPDTAYEKNDTLMVESTPTNEDKEGITKEYAQAISFLKENVVFRKAFKEHFAQGDLKEIRALKKYFKKGVFQFAISPNIYPGDISLFIKDSEEGKIVVSVIDSLLKNDTENLRQLFSYSQEKVVENQSLPKHSTDPDSPVTILFSGIHQHLMRMDVELRETDEPRFFQILLYFDESGILKGAEYQKP